MLSIFYIFRTSDLKRTIVAHFSDEEKDIFLLKKKKDNILDIPVLVYEMLYNLIIKYYY